MKSLPKQFLPPILAFTPLFSKPVWQLALHLIVGAILAPGKRTVSAVLRVMGLENDTHFQNYHRVLNRAVWSSLRASCILLLQIINCFVPSGTLVMGIDDTCSFAALELLDSLRRLSSPVNVVTRLRLDAALYEPAPARHPKQMGRPRKVGKRLPTLQSYLDSPDTCWEQIHLDDWYGGRSIILEFTSQDAIWYHTGLPPVPIRWVLVRDPAGKLEPQAFLCTSLLATPTQILMWFRQRWQVEVTFEEVRSHLGVETQRQWSELGILRTTPALFALFSIVVMCANHLQGSDICSLPESAWYKKNLPTFVDALAWVRQIFWVERFFQISGSTTDMVKVPMPLLDKWFSLICYSA